MEPVPPATKKKGFGPPAFIGGGVLLDPDSQSYIPFRWVGGKMVTGDPTPYPENEQEMARLQGCADGCYQPSLTEHTVPTPHREERIIGFSIFQSVVSNAGSGYLLNGVPISDEEAQKIWEQSPDNPKNQLPPSKP